MVRSGMQPKVWKIRLRKDGKERIAYTQYLGARAEEMYTGDIYEYVAIDRHSGEITAEYRGKKK